MDFGALPPEINSARMYAGPGPESMLAAAAAWNGLAGELHSAADSYGSVISELTSGSWVGPSSTAMSAAAEPYVTWMSATAGQAELAATKAQAAAGAYESAFAMMVPLPMIAANRTQLASLTATNIFGQNTPAISTTEAQYGEMWAQDAAAMYGYAANSAAATQVTPFTAAPQTTSAAGLAAQAAASTQVAGTSTGTGVQSTLSQLLSSIQTTLQSLASPSSSTSSTSGLSGILSGLLGGSSTGSSTITTPGGGTIDSSSILTSLLSSYLVMPGWLGISLTSTMLGSTLGPLMSSSMNLGFTPAIATANQAANAAAAAAAPRRRSGGGSRSRCAGVRVRWRFGRIGRPGSGGLRRHVVGAAELGLGRDTSGDAGWRAFGLGVAGRQSGRDRWAATSGWATDDRRATAGRRDRRGSGCRRCSCFQIRAAPQGADALARCRLHIRPDGASRDVCGTAWNPVAARIHAGNRLSPDQRQRP